MSLFNPASFAQQLCASWDTTPLLRSHAAPGVDYLVRVLEIAFAASMEAEEGRLIKFGLVLLESGEEEGAGIARFTKPRPLSVTEIRRLAPATKLASAFIAVEQSDEGGRIWGTLDVGSDWALFTKGEASSGTGLPFKLIITVRGPGSISIRFSDFLLFSVERGQVAGSSANVLKFGPVHEFFRPVLRELLREALSESPDCGFDEDYSILSYGGEYLRFLVRTLQYAEELGHGGTLVVLREEDATSIANHAAIKYEISGFEVWGQLVQSLRLAHAEIVSARAIDGQAAQVERSSVDSWRAASNGLREARQLLIDRSRFLSRLTQVDGALIVTNRLRVLGFGAVVKDLSGAPPVVRSCRGETGDRFVEERSELYGTRHRSAMTLCQQIECVTFVLSQDGGVKALKSVKGNVLLWPSVSLGPASWFITPEDLIPELRER